MSDNINITLKILDRTMNLTIPASEEETLREANKRIDEITTKFKQRYNDVDNQNLLNMAILQLARKLLETEKNLKKDDVGDELERVCEELDEFIKINQ
ncbi:MAG: cell division protein ZapA [Bacteroidales bacterium]|nr:cell division protein ZapA [Bacteroidales bacterium]